MSEPISEETKINERIEGEHHVAESNGGEWAIYRRENGALVYYFGAASPHISIVSFVRSLDSAANHFIEQGRREALEEVDRLAVILDGLVRGIEMQPGLERDLYAQVLDVAVSLRLITNPPFDGFWDAPAHQKGEGE